MLQEVISTLLKIAQLVLETFNNVRLFMHFVVLEFPLYVLEFTLLTNVITEFPFFLPMVRTGWATF